MLALTASEIARRTQVRLAGLSAVVPVHNEEVAIGEVVVDLAHELPRVAANVELIVVDDGSTDGTSNVLRRLAPTTPALRVIRHAYNQGYGAALRSGFAVARHAYVFIMDGDGQFDPVQLEEAVAALEGYDGVIGYRARRADPLLRRVNTAAWNGLVRALFGLTTRDLNCAFKLLPSALLQREVLVTDGAVISTEILLRAALDGYRLAELAVRHRPRRAGRASGARPQVVARAAVELAELYWRTIRPRTS